MRTIRPRLRTFGARTAGWCRLLAAPTAGYPKIPATAEWLNNRNDLGSSSYSALDQINRDNVSKLRIAWRWKSDNFGPTFRSTTSVRRRLGMADGILYVTRRHPSGRGRHRRHHR